MLPETDASLAAYCFQSLKFNPFKSHDLKGNHSKRESWHPRVPKYNYLNTISTLHEGQWHKKTKLGLAFSESISGSSPLGRRAEKHSVEMSDRAKSERRAPWAKARGWDQCLRAPRRGCKSITVHKREPGTNVSTWNAQDKPPGRFHLLTHLQKASQRAVWP